MAEGGDDMVVIPDEEGEDDGMVDLANKQMAKDYAASLDTVMQDFCDLVHEDRKDALRVTVNALKRKMVTVFPCMQNANVETVLGCVKDNRCLTLRQIMETDTVQETHPEDDVLTGRQVLGGIQPTKKLSQAVLEHVTTLFDNISGTSALMSSAAANVSLLGKLVDEKPSGSSCR